MVIRITWGKLQADKWDEFERTYKATVVAKAKDVKGCVALAAQDAADKDTVLQ